MYYIAYGSNLNIKDMNKRCPSNEVVGSSQLEGYKLVFKGEYNNSYLTIEKSEDSIVPVGIYKLSLDDILKLDKYEGYPKLYKKEYMEIEVNKKKRMALVYIMRDNYSVNIPSYYYLKTCFRGYQDFNLDYNVLTDAYIDSKSNNDNKIKIRR